MKLLLFTYAPAGLGHLRVTDALVDSRPKDFPYIMLGSYDRFITSIHRFTSNNTIARWIFLISQYGITEDIYTFLFRSLLVLTAGGIYKQLKQIIDNRPDVDELWIVATHFGMAHQIGAIKERLSRETKVKIKLIVQVTDDTSQHIWSVGGADLTVVPSNETKQKLLKYAKTRNLCKNFAVTPYPLTPNFTKKLSKNERQEAFLSKNKPINVAVPISGAAVGMKFFLTLIKSMKIISRRFNFWVLVKRSLQTKKFVDELGKLENVHLITGRNDNEMINLYELLYENNLIHIEITKPSEQSFKAILPPSLVGGSILLFTAPVGRQEIENLAFLAKHGLLSGKDERVPRAVRVSKDPILAADYIMWGVDSGLFEKMASDSFRFSEESIKSGEVGPDGAKMFWDVVLKEMS